MLPLTEEIVATTLVSAMQVKALYRDNNNDLDLFNNGIFAVPIGLKSAVQAVTERWTILSFSPNEITLETVIGGSTLLETFTGQFTLSDEAMFGFEGVVSGMTSFQTNDTGQSYPRYSVVFDDLKTIDQRYMDVWPELLAGNDVIEGGSRNDNLLGYAGNDRLITGGGSDFVDGGDGLDVAVLTGESSYEFLDPVVVIKSMSSPTELGVDVSVEYLTIPVQGSSGQTTYLTNVERLEFTNTQVALDFEQGQNGFKAAALITTMFGSDLIATYFAPALSLVDLGSTDTQIAQLVIDLGLIDTSSNEQFFSNIYENVVGVEADPLTQALYVSQLDSGELSHAGLVAIGSNVSIIESQMSELATWRESGLDYLGF